MLSAFCFPRPSFYTHIFFLVFFSLNESICFLFVSFHCLWLSSSYFCEDHMPLINTWNISFPFKEESKDHIGMFPLNLFISLYFFHLYVLGIRFSAGLDLKGSFLRILWLFLLGLCLLCIHKTTVKSEDKVHNPLIIVS